MHGAVREISTKARKSTAGPFSVSTSTDLTLSDSFLFIVFISSLCFLAMSTALSTGSLNALFAVLNSLEYQAIVADQVDESVMMVPVYEQLARLTSVGTSRCGHTVIHC